VERWGGLARRLLDFSQTLSTLGPTLLAALMALAALIGWSLPNYVGRMRRWLDDHVAFHALYRDVRSALFVCTVASMIQRRATASGMGLQESLQRIAQHSEPWLRWHCERSIERIIDHGSQGAEVFDTGVLAGPTMHYLYDIVQARGFEEGLLRVGARIEQRVITQVARRAAALRWALLLAGLATVMGVGAWTMAVVLEMKQVLVGVVGGQGL
jgi:type II secretory pathway component PulF